MANYTGVFSSAPFNNYNGLSGSYFPAGQFSFVCPGATSSPVFVFWTQTGLGGTNYSVPMIQIASSTYEVTTGNQFGSFVVGLVAGTPADCNSGNNLILTDVISSSTMGDCETYVQGSSECELVLARIQTQYYIQYSLDVLWIVAFAGILIYALVKRNWIQDIMNKLFD